MKKGFTLIEVLITTCLIGLFFLVCYPIVNKVTSSLNDLNRSQLSYINKVNFYKRLDKINEFDSLIYFSQSDKLIIYIDNNQIVLHDNYILINDINYEGKLIDVTIRENMILLNICFYNTTDLFVIKGDVYEIYSS